MGMTSSFLFGRVMHKRLFPRVNAFSYRIYYLVYPLTAMCDLARGLQIGVNRSVLLSFHEKDHGAKDGSQLLPWIHGILDEHGFESHRLRVTLVTMPRVLGYVFNPVSFWLCHDEHDDLRAVLCEVNNTFGETHSYLCRPAAGGVITPDLWLTAEKVFHVSPFLKREGSYRFRFDITPRKLAIWIDYYDAEGALQLMTALTGRLAPYDQASFRRAFWAYPLITLRAIVLIHWQALKLIFKRQKFIPKPPQKPEKITATDSITKN